MHIFHSYHIPSNFFLLHFVIKLQKIELVFGHTDERTNERTDRWTDGRGSQNSYLGFVIRLQELKLGLGRTEDGGRTDGRTDGGRTDGRGSQNSYLDCYKDQ